MAACLIKIGKRPFLYGDFRISLQLKKSAHTIQCLIHLAVSLCIRLDYNIQATCTLSVQLSSRQIIDFRCAFIWLLQRLNAGYSFVFHNIHNDILNSSPDITKHQWCFLACP